MGPLGDMESPVREIYLLSYNSRLFPAHWGIWIPYIANPSVGKVIHVTGDAASGFQHEFKRNYNLLTTGRAHKLTLLAKVSSRHVTDTLGDGLFSIDTIAVDDIERQALAIEAPGKSLMSAGAKANIGRKVEIRNCQTWIWDLVSALVADGIFPESALNELQKAPKN